MNQYARMLRFWGLLLLLFLAGGLLAACHLTSGAAATATTTWDEEGALKLQTRVVYENPFMTKEVEILNLSSTRAADLMMAQATLRSRSDATLNLQYKFEWYDLNGLALYTGSAVWKPLLVYGRESKAIQGVAPDPRGREYKLLLRYAD